MPRKKKQKHHRYGELHKTTILGWLANGMTHPQIQLDFNTRFGWKPPLGTIAKFKKQALDTSERTPENLSLEQSETQVKEIKSNVFDTVKIRQFLVTQMIPLIRDNTIDADTKIKRLQGLSGHILKALDGIDTAKKILPEITAQTVNIQQNQILFTADNITDDVWINVVRPRVRAELCEKCKYFQQAKGVK